MSERDRAISEPVDFVLFRAETFLDATPTPYVKQAFTGEFRGLVDAQISTIFKEITINIPKGKGGYLRDLSHFRSTRFSGTPKGLLLNNSSIQQHHKLWASRVLSLLLSHTGVLQPFSNKCAIF
ncbi:MAG: hypothetical protein RLZZ338_3708 [Cyanobacteriota bacterium]